MKTLNKTIGIILLILPFVGAFIVGFLIIGLVKTLAAFGVAIAVFALVTAGLYFLTKRD